MNIPTIGRAGGIFEIFVPGMFLFLNFVAILYLLPFIDDNTKKEFVDQIKNPVLSLVITIGFGYLIGTILRLLQTNSADRWSGEYRKMLIIQDNIRRIIRGRVCSFKFELDYLIDLDKFHLLDKFYLKELREKFKDNKKSFELFGDFEADEVLSQAAQIKCVKKDRRWVIIDKGKNYPVKRKRDRLNVYMKLNWLDKRRRIWSEIRSSKALHRRKKNNFYAYDTFPYINYLKEICDKEVLPLSKDTLNFYKNVWAKGGHGRAFFNFFKTMIISKDERLANELASAEALSRFISGMFFALIFASFLISVTLILRYIADGEIMLLLLLVLFAYLLAIHAILKNFRFIRIKEVQTVFAASFRNKSIFENVDETQNE